MPDFFDEVADLMASSRTVGPYVDRATILASLHQKFATEAELREMFETLKVQAQELTGRDDVAGLVVAPKPGETEWEFLPTNDK